MAGGSDQFSGLHEQINAAQTAIDKVASPEAEDRRVNNSDEATKIFITEVDAVQQFLLANDIENEESYLTDILGILQGSLNPQTLVSLSDDLHSKLEPVLQRIEAVSNPGSTEAAQTAPTPGVPKKPTPTETTLTLQSSDTLTGIAADKFGVDWKETPNAAFVLVQTLNSARKDKDGNAIENANPDVLTDGETINVSSILNGWGDINWGFDGLGWYKGASKAAKAGEWVAALQSKSQEKGEVIAPKPKQYTADTVLDKDAAVAAQAITPKTGTDAGAGTSQNNYDLAEGWEWNTTDKSDLSVKKVEVSKANGTFEGGVDNTPTGHEYDEAEAVQYNIIALKTALADGATATRDSYEIKNTEYEWVAEGTEIKVRRVRNAAEDARKAAELATKTRLTPVDTEYATLVVDGALTGEAIKSWRWENPFDTNNKNLIRIATEAGTAYAAAAPQAGTISAEKAYTEGKIKLEDPRNPKSGFEITEPRRYEWVNSQNQSLGIRELAQEGTFKIDGKDITLNYALLSPGAAAALRATTDGFKSSLSSTVDFYLLRALNAEGQYGAESRARYTPFRAEGDTIKFRDYGIDDDVHDITIPNGITAAQVAEVLNTLTYQAVKTQEKPADAEEAPEGTVLDFYVSGIRIMLNKADFSNRDLSSIIEGLSPQQRHNLETFAKTILEENDDEDIDDTYVRAPFQIDSDYNGEDAIEIKEGWTDYNDDIITASELTAMGVNLSLAQLKEVLNLLWNKNLS